MKAVIVVEPAFLRVVADDEGQDTGKVEIVLPDNSIEDVRAQKRRIVDLLEDEREDLVLTISFPGSPKVEIVAAEKVADVVGS